MFTRKSIGLTQQSIRLTPNPAQAGFYVHWHMASCILRSTKLDFYLLNYRVLEKGKEQWVTI